MSQANSNRLSNIEFLRVFAMFGIIIIHIIGFSCLQQWSHFNYLILSFLTIIGNTGVTMFILISGFFSIQFKEYRLFQFYIKSWVLAVSSWVAYCVFIGQPHEQGGIMIHLFPIISGKYWFITDYIVLYILSPLLNKFQRLGENTQRNILLTILIFGFLLPSFKVNPLNIGHTLGFMVGVYLLGLYLGTHRNFLNHLKVIYIVPTIVISGIIRQYCSFFIGTGDCSVFSLFLSLLFFSCFWKAKFQCSFINRIAKSMVSVYILHLFFIMDLLTPLFHLDDFRYSCWFILLLIGDTFAILFASIALSEIFDFLLNPINRVIISICQK